MLDIDDESPMRMYYAADTKTAMDDIMHYAFSLFETYGFDNICYDDESSDNFIYMYVDTYNGSTDIEPIYI